MIKYFAMFIGFGLICSSYPNHSAAQEWIPQDGDTVSVPVTEMDQGAFTPPAAIQNQYGQSFGGPAAVLPVPVPVPVPAGGATGFNGGYGFQYPGSYYPRDTPLHRFNGYIVCDPPKPAGEAPRETTSGSPGIPVARRMVKITTTRSLAAPGYLQPCPIYTINGEIQKSGSYTTRIPR